MTVDPAFVVDTIDVDREARDRLTRLAAIGRSCVQFYLDTGECLTCEFIGEGEHDEDCLTGEFITDFPEKPEKP